MKRLLMVVVPLLVVGAAVFFLVDRDDDDPPPINEVTVIRVEAAADVCWDALLDTGDPSAEPQRETGCGNRELPLSGAGDRTVSVTRTGGGSPLSVVAVVNGAEAQRESTADAQGTVVLEL